MKKISIFNSIGIVSLFVILTIGYNLKIKQDEAINKSLIFLLQDNQKTNERVTAINRLFYKDCALVSKKDWESHPEWQEHIDKKHTSYGGMCKKFLELEKDK